ASAARSQRRRPLSRLVAVAQRRGEPVGEAPAPAPPAVHAVPTRAGLAGIGPEPRARPLPDVPGHVVEPERTGRERRHRARARVDVTGALRGRILLPPGVAPLLRAAARGVFPFGLGREALAGEGAVGLGLMEIDAVYGVVPLVAGRAVLRRAEPTVVRALADARGHAGEVRARRHLRPIQI